MAWRGLNRGAPALRWLAVVALTVVWGTLAGCARMEPPHNTTGSLFDPEKSSDPGRTNDGFDRQLSYTENLCPPPGTANFMMPAPRNRGSSWQDRMAMRFSPGDRFNLLVPGSPEFSGDYAINADGKVILPFARTVSAVGLTPEQLGEVVEQEFIRSKLFKDEFFRVSIRPVQYAPINVSVSGAVFEPGRITINTIKDSDKLASVLAKYGDSPLERFVPAALRNAGGVRPDADLARVVLRRGGKTYTLNWRGAITGEPVDDIALIENDHIHVEESSCFQSALVRPSQITPPGVRVFQSNLTQPATSNAASAIGKDSQALPYGTRFLACLVSANCVGGSLASNARRYAVLISRNPKTRRTEVIQRSVEELVRSADRDAINPYLMPDDAIACYDSAITDSREVATIIGTMIGPAQQIHSFHKWGSSIATSSQK